MTEPTARPSLLRQVAIRIAPRMGHRLMANVRTLSLLSGQYEAGPAPLVQYERELRSLRREIDELRRDNRRVAELYDVVFERARRDAAAGGAAPAVDGAATTERVAGEFAGDAGADAED